MLRQGDEGTSLDEIFRKAEIDLPQQFRTIDYVRDRSRFEGAMRKARFTEGHMVAIIREADRGRYRRWPSGTGSASR